MALSEPEREAVVQQLVASLDHDEQAPAAVFEAAWDTEIAKRVDGILEGKVRGIPLEQVRAEADRLAAETR